MPSLAMPFHCWNALTAADVLASNVPHPVQPPVEATAGESSLEVAVGLAFLANDKPH